MNSRTTPKVVMRIIPKLSVEKSTVLVTFCLFLYKATQSLLQNSNRIYLYDVLCKASLNVSTEESIFCAHHKMKYPVILSIPKGIHNYTTESKDNSSMMNEQDWKHVTIQRMASRYLVAYRLLFNTPATIACLIYGPVSDRIGRKFCIIMPCLGTLIGCLCFAVSLEPSLTAVPGVVSLVLFGGFCYGMCGKSNAVSMGANSYIADVTSTANRMVHLGRLMGMNFLGLCTGAALLALNYRFYGFPETLIFASVSSSVIMFLVVVFVRESKTFQNTADWSGTVGSLRSSTPDISSQDWSSTQNNACSKVRSVCLSFKSSYKFLFVKRPGNHRSILLLLFATILLNQITKSGEHDAILLYVTVTPFNWPAEMYGYYLVVCFGSMTLVLILVLPIIQRLASPHDLTLIIFGLTARLLQLVTQALTKSTVVLFTSALIGSSGGLINPATRSLISKTVGGEDIGVSFSMVSCMEAMANLIGGGLFIFIYNTTLAVLPGAVFLFDACLQVIMLLTFIWIRFQLQRESS